MEKEKNLKWYDEEIKTLKEHYPFCNKKEMVLLLPNRSYSAIRAKACKLKICKIEHVDKMGFFLREVFLD